jgi:hypothetical protein
MLSLCVINLWLLIYLKRQLNLRKCLMAPILSSNEKNNAGRSPSRNYGLTRMLLGCVALYIITQLPAVALNTLDHLSNAPYCLFQLHWKRNWEPIISTLALVNYSANFLVYMGTSPKYRKMVRRITRHATKACQSTASRNVNGSNRRILSWSRGRPESALS